MRITTKDSELTSKGHLHPGCRARKTSGAEEETNLSNPRTRSQKNIEKLIWNGEPSLMEPKHSLGLLPGLTRSTGSVGSPEPWSSPRRLLSWGHPSPHPTTCHPTPLLVMSTNMPSASAGPRWRARFQDTFPLLCSLGLDSWHSCFHGTLNLQPKVLPTVKTA